MNSARDMNTQNKVPAATLLFWLIKIMATTVGETAADFLNFDLHLGLGITTIVMGVLLLAALILQFASKRYVPWIYWLAVLFISVFGTLVTDNLVDHFGVALQTTTIVFSLALILTFGAWYARERTLSIHTISTRRRELFYWTAILFTFALGTAAGDLVAESFSLGYAVSAMIFGGLIGIITIAYHLRKLGAITAFWIAYVLTRPFGASCGDLLSQPVSEGGLGFGTTSTSIVFLVCILALVTWLMHAQRADS